MDYKKKYEQALENIKKIKAANKDNKELVDFIEYEYPELKESEDERIRKELISFVRGRLSCHDKPNAERDEKYESWIAWLEKQGEHQEYPKDVIDNATSFLANRNEGMPEEEAKDIVNAIITVLNPSYWPKQVEKKPADKVKPKFKIGDTIRLKGSLAEYTIESIDAECYHGRGWGLPISAEDNYKLVEQKPVEWSEEDKKMIDTIIYDLERHGGKEDSCYSAEINWLKSLKERYTWKPSESDILLLERIVNGKSNPQDFQASLGCLIGQLKKLMEE